MKKLKIKDNKILDILIKEYGFEKRYDDRTGELIYLVREYNGFFWSNYTVTIDLENRFVEFIEYGNCKHYDGKKAHYVFTELLCFIYELTKAGIVEIVNIEKEG